MGTDTNTDPQNASPKRSRRGWKIAGISLAAVLVLAGSFVGSVLITDAVAHTQQTSREQAVKDKQFVAFVRTNMPELSTMSASAITGVGQMGCTAFEQGKNQKQLNAEITGKTQFAQVETAKLIGAGTEFYCPQYVPRLGTGPTTTT